MNDTTLIVKKQGERITLVFPGEVTIIESCDLLNRNMDIECFSKEVEGEDVTMTMTETDEMLHLHFPGDVIFMDGHEILIELLMRNVDITAFSGEFNLK